MAETGQKPEQSPTQPEKPANRPVIAVNQLGLWYFHQLSPTSAVYNVPFRVRLEGAVDADVLAQALNAFVGRHEVLRTVYPAYKGAPLPLLLQKWSVQLKQADLRVLPAEEREAEAQRVMREESVRPFALSREVPVRALLVRVTDDQYWFLFNSHHIAFDGRSVTVLLQDVSAFYNALREGRKPDLPPLKVQFSDFARWWQAHLDEERTRILTDFWRAQLAGAPVLDLPSDSPRPAVFTTTGSRDYFSLPSELMRTANRVFQDLGTTGYRGLLSAFLVLLHCYADSTDISIGSPFVPRTELPFDNSMGFFVNTVVLRNRFSPSSTFRQLVVAVGNTVRAALAHCDLPFEQVVDAVHPPRDPGRTPLFQINFRAPKAPYPRLDLCGATSKRAEYIDNGTSKFDLALEIESSEGQRCYFEYRTDLFRKSTIEKMVKDYESILAEVTAHPDTPIADLPLSRQIWTRFRNSAAESDSRRLAGM